MARPVEEEVTSVLLGFLPPGTALRPESTLFVDLGFKSSTALHLIMALEARLAIAVSDAEFAKVRTVEDLTRLAERSQREGGR
jgi:acyl carrier protein